MIYRINNPKFSCFQDPVAEGGLNQAARSDLRLARLVEKSDILPEQICFQAQQAGEKAFKAVLLHRKINFPLTHDLEELLAVFEQTGMAVPSEFEGVGALTPYAV
jgi:HEPN domain-containing protein